MKHFDAYMWRELRKRGDCAQAIRENYPELLNDPVIAHAVVMIEVAQLALDSKMQQLEESEQ